MQIREEATAGLNQSHTVDHQEGLQAFVFEVHCSRQSQHLLSDKRAHFTSWDFPSCDQSVTLQLPASLTSRQLVYNTEHLSHLCCTGAKFDCRGASAMSAKQNWWSRQEDNQSQCFLQALWIIAEQFSYTKRSSQAMWVNKTKSPLCKAVPQHICGLLALNPMYNWGGWEYL